MNSFEFIMVLVSIIIGLGIAELLQGVARMMRGRFEGGLLHLLWTANMLNMLIQCFWSWWMLEGKSDWAYYELLMVLLGPIVMYIISSLLHIPEQWPSRLDAKFINHRRPFFVLFLILMIIFTFGDIQFSQEGSVSRHLVRGVAATLFFLLLLTEKRTLHLIGAIFFLLLQAFFIMNWSWILSKVAA